MGFAELIGRLVFTILVWTIIDSRYKFRIDVASIRLEKVSVLVVLVIGSLALLTDFWRALQGWVPAVQYFPELWQLFLGGTFLAVLFGWIWLAFTRLAKFDQRNAIRFLANVQKRMQRGSTAELAVVASELKHSAWSIMRYAPVRTNVEVPG